MSEFRNFVSEKQKQTVVMVTLNQCSITINQHLLTLLIAECQRFIQASEDMNFRKLLESVKRGFEFTHTLARDDIKKMSKMKGYSLDDYGDTWAISKDGKHIGDYKLKAGTFRTNITSGDLSNIFSR